MEILDDEKRRRVGQLVPATAQALGRAGHHDGGLDPRVTTAAVPDQAQRGDGTVGMSRGADLLRVDQAREGAAGTRRGLEDLIDDEAHVSGLVPNVPAVGTAGRVIAREREQRGGHHVAGRGPLRQKLLVTLRRGPQSVGENDERVRTA